MAVYLGSNKVKVHVGNQAYNINIFSALSKVEEPLLASSDNYVFKSSDELYILPKEDE